MQEHTHAAAAYSSAQEAASGNTHTQAPAEEPEWSPSAGDARSPVDQGVLDADEASAYVGNCAILTMEEVGMTSSRDYGVTKRRMVCGNEDASVRPSGR